MEDLLITIVIVNWNGKKLLPECLDSLKQQTYQKFSTILVDNGSGDSSIDFVKRNYHEVKTIALPRNLGFAAGNNIAFKTIRTKYVALLNNDAVTHPLWLKYLVEALESYPEAGFAASKMLFYGNPKIIDRAGDAYTRAGAGLLRGRGEPASDYNKQEWVFGACAGAALYRTLMLNDIGLFDEDFFLLYEDIDLSFRAQLRGYRCLYIPDAIVYHKISSSIVYDSAMSVYYGQRNLEWNYLKNMPSKLILKTIWLHIIYDLAAAAFFLVKGRIKEFIKAKRDAVKGTKRMLEKRRLIQKTRSVDDDYIWGLLKKEQLFHRFSRRLKKA